MQVNSADISNLSFIVQYDLSAVTPLLKITNASTGPNLAGCTWWLEAKSPSNTFIHQGTQAVPDKTGVWTNWTVPGPWPQPFNQIEWSSLPYSATLFVKDSTNHVFQLQLDTVIMRPSGSTDRSTDNFGWCEMNAEMRCSEGVLYTEDRTNYSYNGLTGTQLEHVFKLIYPEDATGTQPSPIAVPNQPSVLFPISFSDPCYQLYLHAIVEYHYGNDTSVIIKYKRKQQVDISCDIDLCPLLCSFRELSHSATGQPTSSDAQQRMAKIVPLMLEVLMAKMQPLCGIDIRAKIDEIKRIGGFSCECKVSSGINGADPGSPFTINAVGTCGDLQVTKAIVQGRLITIEMQDFSYEFLMANDSDLLDAFSVVEIVDGANCLKSYRLKVNAEELSTGIQSLLLGYSVDMNSGSDFLTAFTITSTLNLVTNKRMFHLDIDGDKMISQDPDNVLEMKPDGFFLNIPSLMTKINNTPAYNAYFCAICPATPIACPLVTGLTATLGAYDSGTNTYAVTLNWSPAVGAISYSVTFGTTTVTETSTSHIFNVAPAATYSYSVTTTCASSSSAAQSGSKVVPAAPAGCAVPTGVTVTPGAWDVATSTYLVLVSWTAAAGAVNYTVATPAGNVITSGTSLTYNQVASTSFTGSVKTNCSSSSSAPVSFTGTTGAAPTLAPAPVFQQQYNYHFGIPLYWHPMLQFTVDPSVTGVIISEGNFLNNTYAIHTTGTILPGDNTLTNNPNAITPTPGGFGAHSVTYQGYDASLVRQIKITLINPAGNAVYEYDEFAQVDSPFIQPSPVPDYVRKTSPTVPFATISGLASHTVTLTFNANGTTGIVFDGSTDAWSIQVDSAPQVDVVSGSSHTFTGLSSGYHWFRMQVTRAGTAQGFAMVPLVINIP